MFDLGDSGEVKIPILIESAGLLSSEASRKPSGTVQPEGSSVSVINKSDEVNSRFGAGIKTSQEHARQTRIMNIRIMPMIASLLGFMAASQNLDF